MYESLQLGTLDLAVGGPVLANFLPELEIINMPFLFESRNMLMQQWTVNLAMIY